MNIRKIFIPVAAGFLISPALMAADIETLSDTLPYSNELLSTAAATDTLIGGDLTVVLGAEYAVGDIITLSFTGAALDNTTLLSSVTTVGDGTFSGVTIGLLNSTSGEAVYRVTDIDVTAGGNTTVGLVVPFAIFGDLEFDAQSVAAAGSVVVSFDAQTDGGLSLDTGGGTDRSTEYLTTGDQWSVEMDFSFDQTVDVNQNREGFEDFNCCDFAQVGLDEDFSFFGSAGFIDQDVVWEGDFSWIIDDDETTAGIQPLPGVVITTCGPMDVTATSISYTCPFGGATWVQLNPAANLDIDGNLAILPATSYTVAVTANYTGFGVAEGSATFAGTDAGEWVLNGYQALIPYMPYGTTIGQVIYLANRGTQSGDITVDWVGLNGTSGTLGVIANLGAGTTLAIGPLIKNALPAAQQANGRLALTITANVPAADVQTNAQYNASGNRAFSLHKDNADD